MKPTPPKLSVPLEPIGDLTTQLSSDMSIDNVLVENQTIASVKHKATTINESKILKSNFSTSSFEGAQMLDVIFGGCGLAGIKFPSISAHRVVFKDCRMSGVQMFEGLLQDVDFANCKLDLANFRYTRFKNVRFLDCSLENADFLGCEFNKVTMPKSDLKGVDFSQSKSSMLDLRNAEITEIKGVISLKGAVISRSQLILLASQLAAEIGIKATDD